MKSFDTELKKYADKVSLKISERRELRERILSYMEYHPLPKQSSAGDGVEALEGIPSESFITLHFNAFYARVAGGVLALILIIAPFLAEQSKPGDVLYLVKTGINEPIQGQLVNSPYEKIEFETKLMERRITEARLLASEGKLTEEVKTKIAEDVKTHTTAVQDGLAELRTQDVDGAAIAEIAFNSSLEVQSAVLSVNENVDNASLIGDILTVVNDAREVVVSNQEDTAPSFESLIAQVELETTRSVELFTAVQKSATEEEVSDIERRMSDIDRLVLEAKKKHETESEVAVDDLVNTLGLLQKLIVFMTDIDVRETVTLESIVPVVLSDAERIVLVEKELHDIELLRGTLTERLIEVPETSIVEKAEEGLVSVGELLLKSTTALTASDIPGAEAGVAEARILITDIDTLTLPFKITETPIVEDGVIIEEGVVGATTTPATSTAPVGTSTLPQ